VTFWDERYGSVDWAFGTEPNDFLRENAGVLAGRRVLCIGDGEGRNGVFLATQGASVTSVDLSEVGLAKARRLADERGVAIATEIADLAEYEPALGSFDAIVSIFCHLPSAVRSIAYPRLIESLTSGGVWLAESYTPDQIPRDTGGPKDPDLMQTAATLPDELDGLVIEHLWEGERTVVEGPFHSGPASVVQVIARRPG
jgi:SAM-dependent methyltransferase